MDSEIQSEPTQRYAANPIVNLTRFPLVIATFPEVVDDAALDALFEGVSRLAERREPYVLLTDASRVQRFAVADPMARILQSVRVVASVESRTAATAIVAPTLAIRTMIRVARVASPSPIPRQTFATLHAAIDWTSERVYELESNRPA